MAFASGAPLPGSVWNDYRVGTSMAGDIARLIGGGLTNIGGIQRQMDKEAKDRAFREAEAARQGSQFDRQLAQSDRHFNVGQEDKYKIASLKQAQGGWDIDPDTGEPVWAGGEAATGPVPMSSVPQAKRAGAAVMAEAPPAPVLPPSVVPGTPGRFIGDVWSPGFDGAPPPATMLAVGSRAVPLAVRKASDAAKNRISDNSRADESLGISREHLALSRDTQARQIAEAQAKRDAAEAELNDLNASLEREGALPQNTRLAGGDAMREATGMGGGLLSRPAPTVGGMSVTPYASADVAKMALTDVFSRRRAEEGGERTAARQEDRQVFTREQFQARQAASNAKNTERMEMARLALEGKVGVELVKAEIDKVKFDINRLLDETPPFNRDKLSSDPEYKALLGQHAELVKSLTGPNGKIAAKVPPAAAPVAPAASPGRAVYEKMPKSFASKAEAVAWFDANTSDLQPDEKAALEEIAVRRVKTGR